MADSFSKNTKFIIPGTQQVHSTIKLIHQVKLFVDLNVPR